MKSFFTSIPKKVKKVLKKKKKEVDPPPDTATAGFNTSSSNPQKAAATGGSASNTSEIVPDVDSSSASRNTGTTKEGVAASGSVSMTDQLANETVVLNISNPNIHKFYFNELKVAAEKFNIGKLLGEGGFGNVYKGRFITTNKDVAIKKLHTTSKQGTREFKNEAEILSRLQHRYIIQLIGYCAENEHRLLVYEYMPLGSLDKCLFERPYGKQQYEVLDWKTRMKIATEAAVGLEYMHDRANPRMIFGDMKCANILLGNGYSVKLSDFGHARELAPGSDTYLESKAFGSLGYCCPHYLSTCVLTFKSDIYSFGVVLLELITGIRTLDEERPTEQRNLILWKDDIFKDKSRVEEIVDPRLQGQYPLKELQNAFNLVLLCTERKYTEKRPSIGYVVNALANIETEPTYSRFLPTETSASSSRHPSTKSSQLF